MEEVFFCLGGRVFHRLIIIGMLAGCTSTERPDGIDTQSPPDSESCANPVNSYVEPEGEQGWLFRIPQDPDQLTTISVDIEDREWQVLMDFDDEYRLWYDSPVGEKPRAPTVCGSLTVGDHGTIEGIGVTLRGRLGNSYRSPDDSPYLKIFVDHTFASATVDGRTQFRLYNHGEDISGIQRYLGYRIWRGELNRPYMSGVYPAPEAGFANFVLNGEEYGIYGTNQDIDEDFIRRWWQIEPGADVNNLYEGEYGTDFSARGCDGSEEGPCYRDLQLQEGPGSSSGSASKLALDALEPMVMKIDGVDIDNGRSSCDALASDDLTGSLDVDRFLEFFALETVIGAREGYSYVQNNYYMYDDGGNYTLIPWGFDQVLYDDKSPLDAMAYIPIGVMDGGACQDLFDQKLRDVLQRINWQRTYDEALVAIELFDGAELDSLGIHNPSDVSATRADIRGFIRDRCMTLSKVYLGEPESICDPIDTK